MNNRINKKTKLKIYCNIIYFTMMFYIFSTSQQHTYLHNKTSNYSLTHINNKHFISSIHESTNTTLEKTYMPYMSDIMLSPTQFLINNDIMFPPTPFSANYENYSGMALSHEFEDEIKELAEKYEIPYQIVLTIGHQESDGNWNNNGVISPTNDYGEFQINECNLAYIEKNLGHTKEEILYDSIKNAEACMFLLKDIMNSDDITSLDDIFGMYNGWVNWKNKKISVNYVSNCNNIINEYFPDYEYQVKNKIK